MAPRAPNYQYERSERTRAKERKRAERLQRREADAQRRKTERDGLIGSEPEPVAQPDTPAKD